MCEQDEFRQGLELGEVNAWLKLLRTCLKELSMLDIGIDKNDISQYKQGKWALERHDSLVQIRTIYQEMDWMVDWEDNLHLADIIEKHLWRNISDKTEPDST